MMDARRISNWNVLSVEAALQQLNSHDDESEEKIAKHCTVRINSLMHVI